MREWDYVEKQEESWARFRQFLDEIITIGDWEYRDGTSMTEDAARLLELLEEMDNESQD